MQETQNGNFYFEIITITDKYIMIIEKRGHVFERQQGGIYGRLLSE